MKTALIALAQTLIVGLMVTLTLLVVIFFIAFGVPQDTWAQTSDDASPLSSDWKTDGNGQKVFNAVGSATFEITETMQVLAPGFVASASNTSPIHYAPGDGASYGYRAGATGDVEWDRSAADTWHTEDNVDVDGTLTTGNLVVEGGYNYDSVQIADGIVDATAVREDKDTWITLAEPPTGFGLGANAVYAGRGRIYATRGTAATGFYKYDISTNAWSSVQSVTTAIARGGTLAYTGSDYIYATNGSSTATFLRYSISANEWTAMADTPATLGTANGGARLIYTGGDFLYLVNGDSTNDFYRYSISANAWTQMGDLPSTGTRFAAPGSIAYTGGNYIYVLRGDSNTDFWRYDIGANSWSAMTSPVPTANSFHEGNWLVWTGGDYIYANKGFSSGSTETLRYSISQNKWETGLSAITTSWSNEGSWAVADNLGHIYGMQGDQATVFRRYNADDLLAGNYRYANGQTWKGNINITDDVIVYDANAAGIMKFASGGAVYAYGDVSALSFTDRTDSPKDATESLKLLQSIKPKARIDGGYGIDYATLDPALKSRVQKTEFRHYLKNYATGSRTELQYEALRDYQDSPDALDENHSIETETIVVEEPGRNLTLTVSAAALAISELEARDKAKDILIAELTARLTELEKNKVPDHEVRIKGLEGK